MKHIRVILAFVLVIPAFFALVLTAEMVEQRGKWTKQVAEERAKQAEKAEELKVVSLQHEQLLKQYDQEMLGWDRYLPSVQVEVVGNGSLTAGVGTNRGVQEGDILFVFKDFGEQSAYVGPFRVAQITPEQSMLTPAWTLRPGEAADWGQPSNWRIRLQVPMANKTRFSQLQADLVVAEEKLASRQNNITVQEKLLADAERDRDQRIMELTGGDPQAAQFSELLPQQFTAGLVEALRDHEDARNVELAAVDDLRRRIKNAYETYLRLIDENKKLFEQLPGSEKVQQVTAGPTGESTPGMAPAGATAVQ